LKALQINKKRYKSPATNLRLFQAADIVSGQNRSLDLTTVDLVSELHKVPSPDKFTFDSPPEKAACRWQQPLIMTTDFYFGIFLQTNDMTSPQRQNKYTLPDKNKISLQIIIKFDKQKHND
jgi:hypothetical protein